MSEQQQELAEVEVIQPDKIDTLEIIPFGTDQRIRLSVNIVRKLIAVPTRSGKLPDDSQCIKFMMLCRAKHLNPFEGDAYFLGYDAQSGPQFSQITAHQVFLKRAEASKGFRGMESGVIVKAQKNDEHDNPIYIERQGDLVYQGETLIGGWAKVYRKELENPFYKRLKLETFSTGQSRWLKDPAGMIVKCAEADALRTAFPTHLGGLYIQEERAPIDIETQEIPIERPKFVQAIADREDKKLSDGSGSDKETPQAEAPSKPLASGGESAEQPGPSKKPAAAPKKKLKRREQATTALSTEREIGPNEKQMMARLNVGNRTKEQLVMVAIQFQALEPGQSWEDIGEDGFADLLHPDNWGLLQPELEKL